MQFAGLKNTPKQKKTDTLINQSQEIRPQGLDLGSSTASNEAIANLDLNLKSRRQSYELQFCLLPKI